MDIDFHYYATYVAACFAGYLEEDALTIATSAQMIDENSRHVLVEKTGVTSGLMGFPDDFKLRHHKDGPAIHTFRTQMTFQGLGDIGTSSVDTLSSIWPVYHFLPGNFQDMRCHSDRWSQRTLKPSYATDAKLKEHFDWLCRPHSSMAIRLVNNCRELIHDTKSVINKHQLENYLVGVTMHVFADTWAHQDFVGFGVRKINSRGEIAEIKNWMGGRWDLSYAFIQPSISNLPTLKGNSYSINSQVTGWKNCDWEECAPKGLAKITDNAAIGHGIVGHLPDHSSLLWKYKPAWSDQEITRNNPIEYFDAFVHLVWAMRCIRLNEPYSPFDVTPQNISSKLPGVTQGKLLSVYKMIALERHPWAVGSNSVRVTEDVKLKDTWDGMIFLHGFQWQDCIENVLSLAHIDSWIPGKSRWLIDAYDTLQTNKEQKNENWYTVNQFKTLDFFKFNIAAKFHYRFVKQQLLAYNKKLLGNWSDGAAYADDLERITGGDPHKIWLQDIVATLSNLQRKEKIREVNEGMTILIRDIESSESLTDVGKVLTTLVENVNSKAPWTYGLLNEKGQKQSSTAFDAIKNIIKDFHLAADTSSTVTEQVKAALREYEAHKTKLLSRQSSESLETEKYLTNILINSSDSEIRLDVCFFLGLSHQCRRPGLKPLTKGSKLYKLLYDVYIKSPPVR